MLLITGGNGLVGSFIIQHFWQEGIPIRAIIRPDARLDLLPAKIRTQIEWIPLRLDEMPDLSPYLQGVQYLVHAAAQVSLLPTSRRQMYRTNVLTTRHLVNTALQYPGITFCQVSSIAALGQGRLPQSREINEKARWENEDQASFYAQTKYWAELEVWRGMAEGLKALIVNPSFVLGPGRWQESSTQIFEYVWKGGRYFPKGWLNYVDVRDVAQLIFKLSQQHPSGERYILNAGTMAFEDILPAMARHLGLPKKPWLPLSPGRAELGIWGAWMQSWFTGKKPGFNRAALQSMNRQVRYSNQKIVQRLDYQFFDLEDTLAWAAQSLIKKYDLKVNR
ncbi:MAG: NAD-dependent epimerase/dehydratase family protein [Microscillaceae bacterium]|nr:NAD-dependent epimerase/dehydratase family protein [Microscillaceae bacterium]